MGGARSTYGGDEKFIQNISRKTWSEERLRHRWEDNIKMVLRYIECWGVDCLHLARHKSQWLKTAMTFRISYKARNFLTSWVTISCYTRTVLHGINCYLVRTFLSGCIVVCCVLMESYALLYQHNGFITNLGYCCVVIVWQLTMLEHHFHDTNACWWTEAAF